MNTRKVPEKSVMVESISKYKNIKDCISHFDCDYRTFHKWLKYYSIYHNFHKGKVGYWKGKELLDETKRKISSTKKLAPKKLKLERVEQKCSVCEKLYINVPMAKSRELNRKYCSNECGKIGLYKWYENRPKHLSQFICEICGNPFENYKCSNYNRFCSVECFKKHNKNWRLSKTYEEIYGKEKAGSIKEKIAIKTAERNRTVIPISTPHKLLREEMIKRKLYDGFETSQPLYYFEIDEFNRDKKLCIEVDGDYWHSLPKRIQQDKRKDTFLKNKGYKVVRIKECDIHNNMDGCVKKIESVLDE